MIFENGTRSLFLTTRDCNESTLIDISAYCTVEGVETCRVR